MNSKVLEELANVETSEEEQHEEESADHSRTYDDDIRAAIPGYDLLHETVAALLQNELGENARVLAVGVGTGEEILRLAPRNPGWRFTGVDPSAAMLAVAREKVAAEGVSDRVELVEGLVQDLPAAEPYDAATLILVQHFLPDDSAKLDILRATAERLKPNAPLIMANMHGDLTAPATQRLYHAWKQRQIARGISPGDAEGMFAGLPTVVHFVPEERIRAQLREAGFTEIEPIVKAFVIGAWLARKGTDS
jgi:tRNA (cmo5U34)-methyltransferase